MNIDSVRSDINTRLKNITEPLNLSFEMNTVFTGIPAFLQKIASF